MSSLPYLSFDHSGESQRRVSDCFKKYAGAQFAELPLVDLLEREAAKFLSHARYRQFKEVHLDRIHQDAYIHASLPLLSGFAGYVASLRQELKEVRLARRQATDQAALEKIALPFKPGNPLEEEIRVLQLQWDKLDELSAMHYADFSALLAYKLKLMLMVRLWSFDEQKGYEIFVESTNALS